MRAKFRIRRDKYGYACAIDRVTDNCTYTVVHLHIGSERNEWLAEKLVKALNGQEVSWPDEVFAETRRCRTCAKKSKRYTSGCAVLTEAIGKFRPCWAWSDNPDWEKEIEIATAQYEIQKGKQEEKEEEKENAHSCTT